MKRVSIISSALIVLLAACAPYMYGVPQAKWDRMSEPERIEAMRVYEREQQARRAAAEERARRQAAEDEARRQAAEEQARRDALERQRAQARQAALERERRERIEKIHRGEGIYGELIRVRVQGGRVRLADRLHRYEPVTFTIADGETRQIAVADPQGRVVDLSASYAGGALSLEGVRFPYDRSWGRGRMYADTGTNGAVQLRGVDVFIEVRDRSTRSERERLRLVVVREPDPPPVVRPPEAPKPPPVVVREKEPPRPPVRQAAPPVVDRPPHSVEINLLSGEMKVRGEKRQLEKVAFRMTEGESRDLELKIGGERHKVSFLYRNGELLIDGTPGRGNDAVRLAYEKGWQAGRVYRIDLKGPAHLENLALRVTGVPQAGQREERR